MSKWKVLGPGIIARIEDKSDTEREVKSSMDRFIERYLEEAMAREEKEKHEKDFLVNSVRKEGIRFFQRLRHSPSNVEVKTFTIDELKIEKLVKHLVEWYVVAKDSINYRWSNIYYLRLVLRTILGETRRKGIRMETDVRNLFRHSIALCAAICANRETEEDKKEFDDDYGSESRVKEVLDSVGNSRDGEKEVEKETFEEICEKLYYHHSEQQRLLNLIGRMKRV